MPKPRKGNLLIQYKCGRDCTHAPAPHERGMCGLAGVNELRELVDWANATREDEHDWMTAEELLARFRKERDAS